MYSGGTYLITTTVDEKDFLYLYNLFPTKGDWGIVSLSPNLLRRLYLSIFIYIKLTKCA